MSPRRDSADGENAAVRRGRDTRAVLVETAAEIFNEVGYYGTDTNKIARAAGFAPATFYKHFENKLEIFLACYPAVVVPDFERLEGGLRSGSSAEATARSAVLAIIEHHRKWLGCYQSLRALALLDPAAAVAYAERKKNATQVLKRLFRAVGAEVGDEEAFVAQHLVSNVADAIVEGLVERLDLDAERVVDVVMRMLVQVARG